MKKMCVVVEIDESEYKADTPTLVLDALRKNHIENSKQTLTVYRSISEIKDLLSGKWIQVSD